MARYKFYGPSFNGTSRIGSYLPAFLAPQTSVGAREYCQAQNMKLIMSQPDKDFAEFLKITPFVINIGVSLNSKDNKYYYDNGEEFTETFDNPDDTFPCVNVQGGTDPIVYNKVVCNAPNGVICTYY